MTILGQWLKPSHYLQSPLVLTQQRGHWYNMWSTEKLQLLQPSKGTTQSKRGQADLQRELLGDLRDVGSPSLLLVQRHHNEVLEELPLLVLDQVPLQGLVPRRLLQPWLHVHQALAVSYGDKDRFWLSLDLCQSINSAWQRLRDEPGITSLQWHCQGLTKRWEPFGSCTVNIDRGGP